MELFEIKEAPLGTAPPKARIRRRYPLAKMEVNEYFDLEPSEGESLRDVKRRVTGAISNWSRVYGTKFITEVLNHSGVVRVWRTE